MATLLWILTLHSVSHVVEARAGDGKRVWDTFLNMSYPDGRLLLPDEGFPPGFIWATGTSAYQVEGAWRTHGKGPSVWDTFTHARHGPSGDVTSDSYHHLDSDLEALRFLGVSHYRFSVAWTRIFPSGVAGRPREQGILFYDGLIRRLLAAGVQPVVTLFHWDLPQALQDAGGWQNDSVVDAFADYAAFCFEAFGDRVKLWITVNNPYAVATHGYGSGLHAPGVSGSHRAPYLVAHNLIKAHARAWHVYHTRFRHRQRGRVTIALGSHWVQPQGAGRPPSAADTDACQRSVEASLGWFASPIFGDGRYPRSLRERLWHTLPEFDESERRAVRGTADLFALSFGPDNFVGVEAKARFGQRLSLGLREVLNWVRAEYDDPEVLVVEAGWLVKAHVGLDDTASMHVHKSFIGESLKAMHWDGVRLVGYTAWSLVDGFEWRSGFSIRRGLFHVDFSSEDKRRWPKSSAHFYQQAVASNGLPASEERAFATGTFPCDFLWGVSDGVVQVETPPVSPQFSDGAVYRWNRGGDGKLQRIAALTATRRRSDCPDYPGIRERISLLKKLQVNAYRFSFNWSLIATGEGATNSSALEYYRCYAKELHRAGIAVVAVLYHPTHHHSGLPAVIARHGGWLNASTAPAFAAYSRHCFAHLGAHVKTWITVNEPGNVRLLDGLRGHDGMAYAAAHNLLRAHAAAWHIYDSEFRGRYGGRVSIALRADWAEPANPYAAADTAAAERALVFQTAWFADPIFRTGLYPTEMRAWLEERLRRRGGHDSGGEATRLPSFTEQEAGLVRGTGDFLAVSHFTARLVRHEQRNGTGYEADQEVRSSVDTTWPRSPSGAAIFPQGIRKALRWIARRYGQSLPIYMMANGLVDRAALHDDARTYYHQSYINEVLKARDLDGVNVTAYFAWAFRDRFLPEVGFFSSAQSGSEAKQSAKALASIVRQRGFPGGASDAAVSTLPCEGLIVASTNSSSSCVPCEFLLQRKPLLAFVAVTLVLVVCFASTAATLRWCRSGRPPSHSTDAVCQHRRCALHVEGTDGDK
ncbi:beta-klotho-like [Petromyzon marinus]|uniref:beta-klotho-like n=1 Tax=Petromyzon marinus TaxID=7757 RepID=UPI003F71D201